MLHDHHAHPDGPSHLRGPHPPRAGRDPGRLPQGRRGEPDGAGRRPADRRRRHRGRAGPRHRAGRAGPGHRRLLHRRGRPPGRPPALARPRAATATSWPPSWSWPTSASPSSSSRSTSTCGLVDELAARGMDKPVVPGIMPITNLASVPRMAQMGAAGAGPDGRAGSRRPAADEAVRRTGIELATELCEKLLAEGAPGLHFYTLNRSLATREIYASLGLPSADRLTGRLAGHGREDHHGGRRHPARPRRAHHPLHRGRRHRRRHLAGGQAGPGRGRRQARQDDRLEGGAGRPEGVRRDRQLAARRDRQHLPGVPDRHQGPAHHAGRRRHPLAQRRPAPDPRPLRLPAPGALVHRACRQPGQAPREGRHGDLPGEHRGHLRRPRGAGGHARGQAADRAAPRRVRLGHPARLRDRHQADLRSPAPSG